MGINNKAKERHAPAVRRSSGNVFADLGLPNPEEQLLKAQLASEICSLINASGMNQTQAARKLGIDQPKVSALMHGRLSGFSTQRLLDFLKSMGRDVTITHRQAQDQKHATLCVVAE
ncbi:MAG TPA: helix-turn-helix transcriptional regulator [Tepidisphaeraceae bacterium]|nr:helix-turn-helix transcriptional regulator [Tepidisphaeraceae bacterium]